MVYIFVTQFHLKKIIIMKLQQWNIVKKNYNTNVSDETYFTKSISKSSFQIVSDIWGETEVKSFSFKKIVSPIVSSETLYNTHNLLNLKLL